MNASGCRLFAPEAFDCVAGTKASVTVKASWSDEPGSAVTW